MKEYWEIIRELREDRDLKQSDVAQVLQTTQQVYSRYETGSRQPSVDVLVQMADIFGVSVDHLLGRQNVESSSLSGFEIELLIASRNADERARQDALKILEAHSVNPNQK